MNGVNSTESATATYFSDQEGKNISLELLSGNPMYLWIDYNGTEKSLNVTLAPTNILKPNQPLLSTHIDLSQYLLESMYVGFSTSTGAVGSDHYILGALIEMDSYKALIFQSFPYFLDKGKQKSYQDK